MYFEFSLLDNGIDSLTKVKESLDKFDELVKDYSFHLIKDATISLHHGTEILLKYLLSSRNESLIFENLNKYIEAKEELQQLKIKKPYKKATGFGIEYYYKYNIFDTNRGNQLKTITLIEALRRVEYLIDIEISDAVKGAVHYLNDERNKIVHHSIKFHGRDDLDGFIDKLKSHFTILLDFFGNNIDGLLQQIDIARYEVTQEELEEQYREMQEYYYERSMSRLAIDPDDGY